MVRDPDRSRASMRATVLPSNQPRHFCRGGVNIARFRGVDPIDAYRPEDWIGSATTRLGAESVGLTTPPDGRTLRSALDEIPVGWLGSAHTQRWGATPALLVKLLDAGQRLPVHCHPSRLFAGEHLSSHFGKTEAWFILDTVGGHPSIYLGVRDDVPEWQLRTWDGNPGPGGAPWCRQPDRGTRRRVRGGGGVAARDRSRCLPRRALGTHRLQRVARVGRIRARPGERALEPRLGRALQCVDRRAMSPEAVARLVHPRERMAEVRPEVLRVFADAADPYFRAELISGCGVTDPSFTILVVLDGEGSIDFSDGAHLPVRRGQTVLVPHGAGAAVIVGDIEVFRCLPPNPATPPEA